MPLKYALIENTLRSDSGAYIARIQRLRSYSLDEIIDLMIKRGSTVTRADILSVLEDFSATLEDCLRDGYGLNTPLFNAAPSIRGVFDSRDAPLDPARHQVRLNLRPGTRLRKVAAQIQLERVGPTTPRPQVLAFEDVATGTRNGTLTPGGLGTLTGERLKYDPSDAQQGIFFRDAGGLETRVEAVARNMPGSLHFQIPASLAPGAYTVAVRTIVRGTSRVRTGSLPHPLQVP